MFILGVLLALANTSTQQEGRKQGGRVQRKRLITENKTTAKLTTVLHPMIHVFKGCSDIPACLVLENIPPFVMLFVAGACRTRWCQRKQKSLNLYFSLLWSRLKISSYCHADADAALLGGMIDQRQRTQRPRPGCNRPPYIPSTTSASETRPDNLPVYPRVRDLWRRQKRITLLRGAAWQ